MPGPGDSIDFTTEQRTLLGQAVLELVVSLEAENADLIADKPIHRDWYNAVPDVSVRSSPWPGASNLVIPFIRTMADSLIARAVLTTFATNKLWTGSSENDFFRDRLDSWFDFLNYGARHGFDTFEPIHDWITEMYIHGHGVLQQVWDDSQRYIVPPNATKPVRVSLGRGPRLRFCPSEYTLYDRENPIAEAEVISIQNNMSWARLTRQAQLSGWDEDCVGKVEGQQGLEGSAAQVRDQRRSQLGLQRPDSTREPHDVREVLLDWPLFKSLSRKFADIRSVSIGEHDVGAITTPIIVYLHRKTGEVLHAIHHPYLLPEWNFYECRYRNIDSRGLAKILEHSQRGMTTGANQAMDAVTFGNSIKAITRDNKLQSKPFTPNQWVITDDIEGFRELTGQKNVMPEMGMLQVLQAIGERVGGQSDPNFGRETRMGGHPQPATNFLGQQANSQVLNTLPMKSIRKALGKVGEHRTIMLQQFEKNQGGWIAKVFDADDAQQIMEVLTSDQVVSGQMRFDVHALSELHNPQEEMNLAINTYQLFTQYASNAAKFYEVAANPQAPPDLKKLMYFSIEGMGEMVKKVLEAAGAEDAEEFVFRLQQGGASGQSLIEAVGPRVRELAQGAAGPAQGAVSGTGLVPIPGGAGPAAAGAGGARGRDIPY
ncbi:MAG: hypothetical protein A2139_02395 [Desulfobacca sp. RBG_16_60_12]|nr:MAG: hypothetical protein A2139_02395 [Desulfobacca sp. RBG_16_60_12]